jgi:hypothetical protein
MTWVVLSQRSPSGKRACPIGASQATLACLLPPLSLCLWVSPVGADPLARVRPLPFSLSLFGGYALSALLAPSRALSR